MAPLRQPLQQQAVGLDLRAAAAAAGIVQPVEAKRPAVPQLLALPEQEPGGVAVVAAPLPAQVQRALPLAQAPLLAPPDALPPGPDADQIVAQAITFVDEIAESSWVKYLRVEPPVDNRNYKELRSLARVLDAWAQDEDTAFKFLIRRFVAVKAADSTGDWSMADSLEGFADARYLLSQDQFLRVRRHSQALKQSFSAVRGGGSGRGARGRNARDRGQSRGRGGGAAGPSSRRSNNLGAPQGGGASAP
jgi:hypothetical protein